MNKNRDAINPCLSRNKPLPQETDFDRHAAYHLEEICKIMDFWLGYNNINTQFLLLKQMCIWLF